MFRVGADRIEVSSGKFGETHFEDMLADISRVAADLPFAGYDSSSLPYDRSIAGHHDIAYHAFVYLRHVLLVDGRDNRVDSLSTAVEAIYRDPHRRTKREREAVSPSRIRTINRTTLAEISRGTQEGSRGGRIVIAGRTISLPNTVTQPRARYTTDNAENRFIKNFLEQCLSIVDLVEESFQARDRIVQDCVAMRKRLSHLLGHALWSEVGRMNQVPAGSQVLQRRRGYRQVFEHFQRLRLSSRLPLSDDKTKDLLEVKDIAELFELWCYFRVVNAMKTVLGGPAVARAGLRATRKQVDVPWDYSVRWANGVALLYNLRFSRSKPVARRSASVPLRPDITLSVPSKTGLQLHIFDAKFRLRNLAKMFSDDEGEKRSGATFKRDDLYKMHTYRDAILHASSAWALYPGDLFRFFDERGKGPAVTEPSQCGSGLNGVGAVPLRPGEDEDSALTEVLRLACGDVVGLPD